MMGNDDFDTRESIDAHFERTWDWLFTGVAPQIKT
jgi:hypothetical protein